MRVCSLTLFLLFLAERKRSEDESTTQEVEVTGADTTKNQEEDPTPASTVVDTPRTSASDVPVSKATDEPTSASKPMKAVNKVWPLTQFFSVSFFVKKSLICLGGQINDPSQVNNCSSVPPSNSLVSVLDP